MPRPISALSALFLVFAVAIAISSTAEAGKPVVKTGGMRGGHMKGGPVAGPRFGGIGGIGRPGYGAYGSGGFNCLGMNNGLAGFGFGFAAASPYSLGQIPVPPYFALHPPVYYSYPVARTYGYSPFPYPGWVPTPDVAAAPPCPQIMDNPFVVPESSDEVPAPAESKPDDKDLAVNDPQPQWITNPFVTQGPLEPQKLPEVQVAAVVHP